MDSELLLELVGDGESVELVKHVDGTFGVYNYAEAIAEDGEVLEVTRSREFLNVYDAHDQFCEYAEGLYEPYQAPKSDDLLEIEIVTDNIDSFVEGFNKFLVECGYLEVSNDEFSDRQALERLVSDQEGE